MVPSIAELSKYLSSPDRNHASLELSWSETTEFDASVLWKGHYLPWNGLSCLAVVCYVLKFCSDSKNDDILIDTVRILNDLALEYDSIPRSHNSHMLKIEGNISRIFFNSFMPKVLKFFAVPKLHQLSETNQYLAGFIHFLLQILNSEAYHIRNEELYAPPQEGIKYLLTFPGDERSIRKELTFLLIILGDEPFQCTELEEVKNLLSEIEVMANEAGRFIYSCVFASSPINGSRSYMGLRALLEKIGFLNAKIEEHCTKFSKLPSRVTESERAAAVDSLFIVDSLLEDLKSLMNNQVDVSDDMKNHIMTIHNVLISARSFIKDIKVTQREEIEEVKECVNQIRDLAYEAEYLINSFVVGNIPVWYLTLRLPNVIHKFELIRFEEIKKLYEINGIRVSEDSSSQADKEIPKDLVDDIVVGLDDERTKILDDLIGGSRNRQTISIFGMPGLGKTTLAKNLFDNRSISDHFDERAWCVVSQTYNKKNVLIDLLMSSASKPNKDSLLNMEDESLAIMIHKSLKQRRYLIVMDDVWNSNVWDDLSRFFPDDKNGSRILLTSRIRDTAPICSVFHTLPLLSKDQCLELLVKKVFHQEPFPSQLRQIGNRIAQKCNGLPLAAVVTAGILANMEKEESVWMEVEQSLELYTNDCTEILELSYKNLPDHLKLCFLYLGVFPEDTEIPVRKLLWLWIAEGFIHKEEERSPEDVAKKYLMDLINRSLVQISRYKSTGEVKACTIHDLLRDMCLIRAQEENFLNLVKDDQFSTYVKYHRLCANSATSAYFRPFSLHCRSFFGHLSDPSSCLPQMKLLRVMELSRTLEMDFSYKLKSIDMLVHLRYMVVDRMPELIVGNLVNLEFLRIDSLKHSVYVPSIILKMVKLKHLHVRLRAKFKEDCDSSQANNLQTLSIVCIYNDKAYQILRCSRYLRKLICMCGPNLPDFCILTELESLKIAVRDIFQVPKNPTLISFPSSIKKLSLFGTCLPWERMSIIRRLPKLRVLKLLGDAFDGEEWDTSDGEFKELRFLKLDHLKLKRWILSSDNFPKLMHLVLHKCDKLQSLSTELGDIPTLEMIEVHYCGYEASISAVQIEEEQQEIGNEELKVIITDSEWSKEELILKNKEVEVERSNE